ncbi:MAG: glycoside hydrolase family 97 catalytic domain-containing protein [Gemmatimonadetes bacterium]|nr:glycoside hydrolase family 97 catalytic domain-containing protein [Gemmatimonadota bacterium]
MRLPTSARRTAAISAALGAALLFLVAARQQPAGTMVRSPDGRTVVTIADREGKLTWQATRDGRPVVTPSALGFTFRDGPPLGEGMRITETAQREFDDTFTLPWGEVREVRDRFREVRVHAVELAGLRRELWLVVRVFDDGIGFRYELPAQANLRQFEIMEERTEFAMAEDMKAWWIPADVSSPDRAEMLFSSGPVSKLRLVHTPLTLVASSGLHAVIHEADLVDYAGMYLQGRSESRTLTASLAKWKDGAAVKGRTPFQTPWRTVQLADRPEDLAPSTLSLRLNPPSRIADTRWITPMKYDGIWWGMHVNTMTWGQGPIHGATTANTRQYIDFAAANGLGGTLVEGWNVGWDVDWMKQGDGFSFTRPYPDYDLPGLAAYAREKGVALIVHNETGGFVENYERQLDSAFALYERLGVRVIKTGYVGDTVNPGGHAHQSQYMVRHHRRVIETAARHGISVVMHEPIKDTGERRTWPNMLSREGARGMEFNAWGGEGGNPPEHETILFFTRFLAGPMDFTPGVFNLTVSRSGTNVPRTPQESRPRSTLARQLALYVVIPSPVQMAADLPENYAGQAAFQFIRDVAVDWDTTRVLHGRIGDDVVVARRAKGRDEWFVGAITDEESREIAVPLDFLPAGRSFAADVYADAADASWDANPTAISITQRTLTARDTLRIRMARGGGQAIRLRPAGSALDPSSPFRVGPDEVRQGGFVARALGRDTIVSTYPRAAREVHFKFALNGRDNEFPPGIEHTINLRPRTGRVATPLYAFAVEPKPLLPRPEDAGEGEDGEAAVTIRLDLRTVRDAIRTRGWYKPPLGDTIRALSRVTAIGDTGPLVWDINAVPAGAPQDLTDPDGDGIFEATLPFRTEYLRPLDAQGRAIWTRTADLSRFPELVSPEPLVDATYRMSLEELTQLVREDGALAAGAKWPGVWTRDVSLSALLSLAIVVPDAVKVSLMKKVDAQGRIIQDTGTGGSWPVSTDRMTWALAAWEVYAVTGDTAWLRSSYDIIKRSAAADAHVALDRATGLVRGESSFEDWREQSYPRWMQPADIYQGFALGTNAVHHGAYRVLADMGRALGRPAAEIAQWERTAAGIRDGIAREFWMPELQRHAQFLYGRTALARSPRYEALGEALLVLTEGAAADSAGAALLFAPSVDFGTPTFWPFISGEPFYHNATIWPFVAAYSTWAAARVGSDAAVDFGYRTLVRAPALFLTNKENLVAETGHFEGTALNSDRQLWSVAGTLALQYRVLFGMRFERDRLVLAPAVPHSLLPADGAARTERVLRGVRYRGATLEIRVRASAACGGYRATLDGAPLPLDAGQEVAIPASLIGAHAVVIEVRACRTEAVARQSSGVRFAPATPRARLGGTATAAVLEWDTVPGAARYVVHVNGEPVDTLGTRRRPIPRTMQLAEWQVEAVDSAGTGSFLSEPVRVIAPAGERLLAPTPTGASVRTERAGAPITVRTTVTEPGRYAVDVWYSNGNGPVNTEDKAAVRTLFLNGLATGAVVMPQRGAGSWSERGWSNPVVLTLTRGVQTLSLRWDPRDENMNGTINAADVHRVRVTRLPDAP